MTRIIQADGELITFEITSNKLAQLAFSGVLQVILYLTFCLNAKSNKPACHRHGKSRLILF